MKRALNRFAAIALALLSISLFGADERPLGQSTENVFIQYQYKNAGSRAWISSNTTMRGATTESMMVNTLSVRHPQAEIRILAAIFAGRIVRASVRYQYRRENGAWITSSAIVLNALTESMARNQLSGRHPGMEIRILSMINQ